jgi:hypothetical protein
VLVYGWLAFTFELCRQRVMDPSIDADYVADSCAHALLDAVARIPDLPHPRVISACSPAVTAGEHAEVAGFVGGRRHDG